MAISLNAVWEVRTAGNDTNGGGFITGAAGTDYSQQDAKNTVGSDISTTDAVANGTTTLTSATANFGTTIVGNCIYLQGGTGALAAVRRQVTARASTTSITLDASVAAGTGITMNIGGALASPGTAGIQAILAGMIVWIKAGTYTITSATINISGGTFSSAARVMVEGYQTVRGDLGTKPLIQASGISTFTLFILSQQASYISNIEVDGASLTSSRGFSSNGTVYKCKASNCTNSGFSGGLVSDCVGTGCSTQAVFVAGNYYNCIAHDNTIFGFHLNQVANSAKNCIADTCTGATNEGFLLAGTECVALNCIAYNNGRDGFRQNGNNCRVENCIAENNTGVGINVNNIDTAVIRNCATFNNTGGSITLGTGKFVTSTGNVTGSGSFFTNAAGQNFALNSTAGAGAVCRAAGFPGVLPVGGTGFIDIGSLQHQDAAGGGEQSHVF